MEHYRADGVRITHDPFHPDMEAKYGRPGETDKEVSNSEEQYNDHNQNQ